jgi:phosphohistidine phosphatase
VHAPLRSGFDRRDALALLGAAGADDRVLVVGHEPDFSQVVHDLTGAGSTSRRAASPACGSTAAGAS